VEELPEPGAVEPAGVRAVSRGAEQQLGDADLERTADRVGARKGTV
jgi:hypothetical protein